MTHDHDVAAKSQRKTWTVPDMAVLPAADAENSPIPSGADGTISLGS